MTAALHRCILRCAALHTRNGARCIPSPLRGEREACNTLPALHRPLWERRTESWQPLLSPSS
jgi:hypothetical protein